MPVDAAGIDPDVRRWVEHEMGAEIVGARRTASGGSRLTWLVDLGDGASIVVRCEGEGSFTGTEINLRREAQALDALGATSVPVPKVHAVRPDGSAVVLERLEGTDDLSVFTDAQQASIMDELAAVLADLHRIDVTELALPGFVVPTTAEDHARLDIGMWRRLSAPCESLDPLIDYCAGWLVANAPTEVTSTSFVQGDTGPGNFMTTDTGLTGLIDMEFAHLGDPMDDLAWVWMRTRDDAPPRQFFDSYSRHGGVPIDEEIVAYYRLAVDYRCAVTTSLAVDRGRGARGWAPYVLETQRFLDGIARRIAALADVEMPSVDVLDHRSTARTPMFDRLNSGLRDAARALRATDAAAASDARNDQILIHYLRAHDQIGHAVAAHDEADRLEVLGVGGDDPGGLRRLAADAGERGDEEVLGYLLRRQRRTRQLWSTLLDR